MVLYFTAGLTLIAGLSLLLWTGLTGVPSLPSSRSEIKAVIALVKEANLPRHSVIIDLGSGWGTLVIALARAFPDASVHGIEASPFPYFVSRLRTFRLSNVSLRLGDFFRGDLSNADVITCYLMPGLMQGVSDLLDSAAKPGARVVSNTFLFRGRVTSAVYQGSWGGTVALYNWPAREWVV